MFLLRNLLVVICGVFIASGAVSGEEVKKAVGDEVSFKLDKIVPPVTSITWKHISSSGTVKAIEWEDKAFETPNQRFNGITTLDTTTGQITIKKLQLEHSGVYTIDISGKEQTQRFTLTVLERVPKPVIKIEPTGNTDVVYLICEYSETIIWKNSTGGILKGSARQTKGEELVVKKEGNPENFYTCSLQNAVSEDTSDRIYERDLFKGAGHWWISIPILVILFVVPFVLYKFCKPFHVLVYNSCGEKPCIGGCLSCLDGTKKDGDKKSDEKSTNQNTEASSSAKMLVEVKTDDDQSPTATL